ncbi:hypothetical protein QOZ09_32740, partial [Pseudomonas aeruginosa]|uniref:hypothetical protein n=1 Tax=Pseudomonas aeruginosa TaxID=287 RepID=UPI0034579E95
DKIKIPNTITCEEIRFCVLGDIGCQLGEILLNHISFPVTLTSLQTYFPFMQATDLETVRFNSGLTTSTWPTYPMHGTYRL